MSKLIDITGQRFGFWVVKRRADNSKNGLVQWLCTCECGTEKTITTNSLRSGNSTSCGCNHAPDLTNLKFGDITVLYLDENKKHSKRYWVCKCICHNLLTLTTNQIRNEPHVCDGHFNLKNTNSTLLQQNIKLIKEQQLLILSLNEELQKSSELLTKLRLQIK